MLSITATIAFLNVITVLPPAQCSRQHPPATSQLRALAERLHPEAFAEAAPANSNIVALVLDRACRVRYHAAGPSPVGGFTGDSLLTAMIPQAGQHPFEISGITLIQRHQQLIVVYRVVEADASP
jgi:hypothetical protein